ncbi:hypothetical protein G3580_01830 [Nitrogeniibacter mangrovi]|uniref:Transmembrane protein n=1 Tax=Nitrogeniibacter mangrovi TaxID=2016596 RepID=A0A6C1AYM9_9RHOO|nr:hypothetical protein [Nitrogeniibacter mangrovi]QID16471.1 hypothetical protein G3580_01830 [Nitrogeniibacter mangrovi]
MTARARHLLLTVVAGLLIALYIGLLHHFTAAGTPSQTGAALALLPMALTTLWLAWTSRHRRVALALWLTGLALLIGFRHVLAARFAYIELIQHAGTFASLAGLFGRTLGAGRTPMVSLFAQTVHGPLAPPLARYTRRVTVAWTAVFCLMAAASLVLFFSGHVASWSLFANVLTPILIPAVFLIEYLVRRRVLPAALQTGLVDSIRSAWPAFERWSAHREHLRATSSGSPRQP